jgi:hypothetical protein
LWSTSSQLSPLLSRIFFTHHLPFSTPPFICSLHYLSHSPSQHILAVHVSLRTWPAVPIGEINVAISRHDAFSFLQRIPIPTIIAFVWIQRYIVNNVTYNLFLSKYVWYITYLISHSSDSSCLVYSSVLCFTDYSAR